MAEYFVAKLDNNCFRLRVELSHEVAMFTFMHFENTYKILTYAFLSKESTQSKVFISLGGWTKVGIDKAKPILELGMQHYKSFMCDFNNEPNF